jgi:hypothetical protein
MWDDRFLFVVAALLTILYWILKDRLDRKFLLVGCIALTVLILGGRAWLYWSDAQTDIRRTILASSRVPSIGNAIAILLGTVFGIFTARFVASLFPSGSGLPLDSEFKKRDPLVGASVLALLCVIYSLPLYSDAITNILSATGLSSVKTPFVELTLKERGTKGYVSASGTQPSLSGVARSSSPIPGLTWLEDDTNFTTFSADESYIHFFETNVIDSEQYKRAVTDAENFLPQAHLLSMCLNGYVKTIPDSALLVVDIKPVLESLFLQHRDMKKTDTGKLHFEFWPRIKKINQYVNTNFKVMLCHFDPLEELVAEKNKEEPFKKKEELVAEKTQPYTTLVLADLVYAHGAQDEGIEILADWLTKNPYKNVVPQWWALRVESRIALWMADVAGQNNVAYRSFIKTYNDDLRNYFEHRHVSLDQLEVRCKSWSSEKQQTLNSEELLTEQRAFFLLLSAEDESLRTELNFVGEEGAFDALEDLHRRAATLVNFGPECLPKTGSFDQPLRDATIADHKVTAGLIGLTVAERMHTLASSRGDHNRAADIARKAEEFLRVGYAQLSERVTKDRKQDEKKEWNEQIFSQSNWEKSTNLAARALLQLRSKD